MYRHYNYIYNIVIICNLHIYSSTSNYKILLVTKAKMSNKLSDTQIWVQKSPAKACPSVALQKQILSKVWKFIMQEPSKVNPPWWQVEALFGLGGLGGGCWWTIGVRMETDKSWSVGWSRASSSHLTFKKVPYQRSAPQMNLFQVGQKHIYVNSVRIMEHNVDFWHVGSFKAKRQRMHEMFFEFLWWFW